MSKSTAVVDVKSAWESKINWVQLIGVVAMIGTLTGLFDISAADQATIVGGILAVQGALTVILRTWFTKSVTKASAEKL